MDQQFKLTAQEKFLKHPGTEIFFVTSDGFYFFEEDRAKQHAGETLKDNEVIPVTKEEAFEGEHKPQTFKYTLTDEDFVNNPVLTEQGLKVGEEIEIALAVDVGEEELEAYKLSIGNAIAESKAAIVAEK